MEQEFNIYVSPSVKIIELEIEKGFAASGGTNGFGENGGAWS